MIARAGPDTNFFVLSDHGFQAAKGERYRIQLHLDRVLEHLGLLVRDEGRIDPVQSLYDAPVGVKIHPQVFYLKQRFHIRLQYDC